MNKNRSVLFLRRFKITILALSSMLVVTCKKSIHRPTDRPVVYPPRLVHYKVSGSHVRLSYIDSISAFQSNQLVEGNFDYEFSRGPGTSIGINVDPADSTDKVYSWEIYIDNKLYANAFSEGGAYFNIPYP